MQIFTISALENLTEKLAENNSIWQLRKNPQRKNSCPPMDTRWALTNQFNGLVYRTVTLNFQQHDLLPMNQNYGIRDILW